MMSTTKLVHHDDGKEKWQSHEVYLQYPDDYIGMKFEGHGYGETLTEAYEDFKRQYIQAYEQAQALTALLLDTDALWPPTEVDCMGKEV